MFAFTPSKFVILHQSIIENLVILWTKMFYENFSGMENIEKTRKVMLMYLPVDTFANMKR